MTRPLPRTLLTALLALALLLGACGDDDGDGAGPGPGPASGPEAREAALATVADDVIVAGYQDLVTSLDGLATTLEELCATPGTGARDEARGAWRRAATSWQATRATGIGPAMDRRLMADVGFAARPASVESLLEGDDPVDVEGLATTGSAFRGVHAVELLLFGDGSDDLLTPAGARRCTMAASAADLAGAAAVTVRDDWTEVGDDRASSYRDHFVAGIDGDPLMSVDALVNQLIAALTTVDDSGLRDLVAAEALEDAPTTRRDGPGAYRMAQHRALVEAVAAASTGPRGGGGALAALVEDRSPDTAERLVGLADAAVEAMAALPDSVAEAFADRDALAAASEAVAALKVLLSTEVASQLGITIRFSDADGDS